VGSPVKINSTTRGGISALSFVCEGEALFVDPNKNNYNQKVWIQFFLFISLFARMSAAFISIGYPHSPQSLTLRINFPILIREF